MRGYFELPAGRVDVIPFARHGMRKAGATDDRNTVVVVIGGLAVR